MYGVPARQGQYEDLRKAGYWVQLTNTNRILFVRCLFKTPRARVVFQFTLMWQQDECFIINII